MTAPDIHCLPAVELTVLKYFFGCVKALMKRAKANSNAQLGKYNPADESAEASKGMYEKGYTY